MSTASSQLNDTITLTTQDNPPTRHVVSRSRLMVLSPFFRDLLTLPQVGNSEIHAPVEIPLTDPMANLKGFLAVLKDDEEYLAVLQHDDWIHLSHMADKYDCKVAIKEVVAWMWQLISSGQYFVGFDLAVEIQHTQAIQMVWADAADCHWDSVLTRTAFGQRIADSIKVRRQSVQTRLLDAELDLDDHNCKCTDEARQSVWGLLIYRVMKGGRLSKTFQFKFKEELAQIRDDNVLKVCKDCEVYIASYGDLLDKDFPPELRIVGE